MQIEIKVPVSGPDLSGNPRTFLAVVSSEPDRYGVPLNPAQARTLAECLLVAANAVEAADQAKATIERMTAA